MARIYWCEFPSECNWKNIAEWLGKETLITYIACTSRTNYEKQKQEIQIYSKNIEVNAWPILPKKKGYWFSGFTTKKDIDSLDQYKGIKIKLDIEPPIPKSYSFFTALDWLFLNLLRKAPNKKYLQQKINSLSKDTDIILSTFPLPAFLLEQLGWTKNKRIKYNYMFYSTFIPKILLPLYKIYYKNFCKNKNVFFALGIIGHGIFNNEPEYNSIKELKQDLQFFKKQKKHNLVFFELSGLSKEKEYFLATREKDIRRESS